MKEHLKNLIAQGKIKEAIKELLQITNQESDLHNHVIQQSARLSELEKQQSLGTEDNTALNMTRNQVIAALLSIIDDMPNKNNKRLQSDTAQTIVQNAEKIYNINHIDNANFQ